MQLQYAVEHCHEEGQYLSQHSLVLEAAVMTAAASAAAAAVAAAAAAAAVVSGFTTLLTSQVISVAFYSEREKPIIFAQRL